MYIIKFLFQPEDDRLPMYLMKDGGFCAVGETDSSFTDDYLRTRLKIFKSHKDAEAWLTSWDKDIVLDPYLREGDIASIVHYYQCECTPITGYAYSTNKQFHRLLFQQPPYGSPDRLDAVPVPAKVIQHTA